MPANTHPSRTRIDFLKSLYIVFLYNFDYRSHVQFWHNFPLKKYGFNTIELFLRFVWSGTGTYPTAMHAELCNAIESLCVNKKLNIETTLIADLFKVNNGSMFSAKLALEFIEPVLTTLFRKRTGELMFDRVGYWQRLMSKGTIHRVIKKVKSGDEIAYCTAIDYPLDIFPFNGNIWIRPFIYSLAIFSNSKLVEFKTIAEKLTPRQLVKIYYPDNTIILSEYFEKCTLANLKGSFPMDEDENKVVWKCIRNLEHPTVPFGFIAQTHQYYGCPSHICCFKIRQIQTGKKTPLSPLFDILLRNRNTFAREASQKHEALLATINCNYACEFYKKTGRLYINGGLISEGVPARIGVKMIKAYTRNKTTTFPNTFFTADQTIVKSKLDKSFNINLKRILYQFSKKAPSIKILRNTGYGSCEFTVDSDLTFTEIDT